MTILSDTNLNPRRKYAAIQHWHDYYQPYLDSFARYGALSKEQLGLITGHTPTTVRTAIRGRLKTDGGKYNLMWVIVGSESRAENLRQVMLPMYQALKAELPAGYDCLRHEANTRNSSKGCF